MRRVTHATSFDYGALTIAFSIFCSVGLFFDFSGDIDGDRRARRPVYVCARTCVSARGCIHMCVTVRCSVCCSGVLHHVLQCVAVCAAVCVCCNVCCMCVAVCVECGCLQKKGPENKEGNTRERSTKKTTIHRRERVSVHTLLQM